MGETATQIRRRREASYRLPPLDDGRRDPLDPLDPPPATECCQRGCPQAPGLGDCPLPALECVFFHQRKRALDAEGAGW